MLYRIARPFLFQLNPETAHELAFPAFRLMQRMGLSGLPGGPLRGAPVRVMGIDFPNPVGLAAGLDKNAAYLPLLAAFGFGFLEAGTVTPRGQPGNPKPRIFRLVSANAIINRMGFNNLGVDNFIENVKRSRYEGILGINIGKNLDTPVERAVDDYLICLRKVYPHASYITINISSPNTRNLRQLQEADELGGLLATLSAEREKLARGGRRVPLALKIAPDLDAAQIGAIATLVVEHGIDAVIATNTTVSRKGVEGLPHGDEAGGLSGAPIREAATAAQRILAGALKGRVPIIGSGGVMSAADAQEKFAAGASLVQVYSGLIYRGPALVREIVDAVAARARAA